MAAKYILGILAGLFLIGAVCGVARSGGKLNPQSRTWLLIGTIFAAVSTWLWYRS